MHRLKTARYRAVDTAYRRRPAVVGDVGAITRQIAGRNVLVTVAFADVNAARWQIALLRHYVPGVVHVVVDNSPTPETAARLRHVVEAEGALYLQLPPNPWTGKAPSRSHGIALNWTWHNLIRPAAPHAFGFIDDDLFPTATDDPFAPLADQDVYGQVRRNGDRWFLWAGFCMFRFDKVADLPLDFGQDWFIGLDTGGGNWEPLYSHIDLSTIRQAETRFVPFRPDLAVEDGPLQWVGPWLHEVGLMGRPDLFEEKRDSVEAIIAPHLAAAMRPFVEKETAASTCGRAAMPETSRATDSGADAPRILEIGQTGFMHAAFPQTTQFYSTWPDETASDPERGRHLVTFATLRELSERLADPSFDLVVVHALPFAPWSLRALGRLLFRRSVLHGSLPLARALAPQLLRGRVAAPIAVLDFDDPAVIDRANTFLLDRATVWFKRELPPDNWQAFTGTLHWRVPTARFRRVARNRRRLEKLAPLSLGVPLQVFGRALPSPVPEREKTADVFFAGRVKDSSTVRERGLDELLALRSEGIVVDIPDAPLPLDAYLDRLARARLVWTPEGYGWQCFRLYEAALCGSVPLANRPTIAQHAPLVDGEHALYYDVEPGGLSRAVRAALADRTRLATIAAAGRAHVLAHHTPVAIAQHVVETTLRRAGRPFVSAETSVRP